MKKSRVERTTTGYRFILVILSRADTYAPTKVTAHKYNSLANFAIIQLAVKIKKNTATLSRDLSLLLRRYTRVLRNSIPHASSPNFVYNNEFEVGRKSRRAYVGAAIALRYFVRAVTAVKTRRRYNIPALLRLPIFPTGISSSFPLADRNAAR